VYVASRPRETRHEAGGHRVRGHHHDDGDRHGRLPRRVDGWVGERDDDVDLETHELGRETGQPIQLLLGGAHLERDVLPIHPTQLAKSLPECGDPWTARFGGDGRQVSDLPDFPRLPLGRERRDQGTRQ
jgi:hypothetical protein